MNYHKKKKALLFQGPEGQFKAQTDSLAYFYFIGA